MKKSFLLLTFFVLSASLSFGQFLYVLDSASTRNATYTDLGSLGTAISTNFFGSPIDYDDDVSSVQNIGFNFTFNGRVFTNFILCSNGFIKLGNLAPDAFNYDFTTSGDSNIIAPFNYDLQGGSSPEYRLHTSGAAGSRVCTIQFKNIKDATFVSNQYANINFQIKLYETSNNIEFVYGSFSSTVDAPASISAFVGILAAGGQQNVYVRKKASDAWSAPTFIDGDYGLGNKFNTKNSLLPDNGRSYLFKTNPSRNQDGKVASVYTLNQLPIPNGAPHQISAVIQNKGSQTISNLQATLNITGANSFNTTATISSLAPQASTTVVFNGFTPSTSGTNTISVSLPADDYNTNNSLAVTQTVGTSIFSYADESSPVGVAGFGAGSGLILTKYRVNGSAVINSVRAHISDDISSAGKTIYGVVLDTLGNILSTTPNYIIASGDFLSYKEFLFSTPPTITNKAFLIGIAQTAAGSFTSYFPISYQDEGLISRSGAYYSASLSGNSILERTDLGRLMIQAILTAALPVNIESFTAVRNGKQNDVKWEVGVESNVSHYLLERSTQGRIFSAIAEVPATGLRQYAYSDVNPNRGMNFYRLRSVDKDGRESLSEIRVVNNPSDNQLTVFPNPAKDKIKVIYPSAFPSSGLLVVIDVNGKRLLTRNVNIQEGQNIYPISINELPSGSYYVNLITKQGKVSRCFVKQ